MRWLLILSFLFLSSCSLFSPQPTRQNPLQTKNVPFQAPRTNDGRLRHRIVVLPFLDAKTDRSQRVRERARLTVVGTLQRTGNFVLVSPNDFSKDVGQFVNESNNYDLEALAPLSSSMGVAALVEGKILEVKAKRVSDSVGLFRKLTARITTAVRIRVVSAKSGKIIMDEVREATVEAETTRVAEYSYSDRFLEEDPHLVQKAVGKAFWGAIQKIALSVEKLSWEGRVALISGERIFVNAGRLSGIQIGDVLKITEEGEEVFDPESGVFLGRAPGRMKGTIEVVSYFGKDGAIAIVHSGSGFKENDRVEVY
ncbi:MAG: hypothetical protein KDD61_10780 [Bdellovibrionales bacterium]|nr:hypothetical protein [Bdellovibrionales bacterium]